MFRSSAIAALLVGPLLTHPATAQVIVLDEIVVNPTTDGEEGEETAYETPAPVDVITREEINRETGAGVASVLQNVPGVIAPTNADDPGVAVNIRGMQDFGRVSVTIDGAQQNFGRSGHSANGVVYIDPNMVKSIEVTRGPVAVVGGGAIGGSVAFTTIDADDVLKGDETVAARVTTSAESNGPAGSIHGEAATRIGDAFDIVAAATLRSAGDYTTGDGDELLSAQDLLSGLIKARLRVAEGHETTLTALRLRNNYDNGISTVRRTETTDTTLSLGHHWAPADNDLIDLQARAYYTGTHLDQEDVDGDLLGAQRSFDVATFGGELYNVARFDAYGFSNETIVGADGYVDHVETRDPEGYAEGSTPSGDRQVYGAYIQHTVRRGWFEVIGALRYDGYGLQGTDETTGDDIDRTGGRISPKITVSVTPVDPVTVYATYAEAFRSPSVTETLIQGEHPPPVTFPFYPNPDLKPEVAHNIEAGLMLRFNDLLTAGDKLRLKGSAFQNNVTDYIDLECSTFPLPGGCTYVNIDEAQIRGIELEGLYDAGRFYGQLAATVLDSRNLDEGGELTNVPPSRVSATLGMRAFEGRLDIGATVTLVGEKKDASELFGLTGDSYGLLDAYANYMLDEDTVASLSLKNILDREYTQYLNLQASPGFTAIFSVTRRFGGSPKLASLSGAF
ncbi:TonB-dependent hemoglobin/transferrin/lactoferrin family receptor [Acuticoccus sp. 2012]|uniref:TonB-dependent hemoglobin/transferrin/lactoferrin family receptor n=1 Tax=Acuticoccus mangrovi TaxID=2796142 RepID=A0A934MFZ8_9HYPH|nr:TonB-dependent hemoglobin/transferrin/lactoferrin family receptor [Acuticoccus mangrovi]